jgi:HEAT repeat protein
MPFPPLQRRPKRVAPLLGALGAALALWPAAHAAPQAPGPAPAPATPASSTGTAGAPAASPTRPDPAAAAVARRVGELIEKLRATTGASERLAIADQLVAIGPDAVPFLLTEVERGLVRTWPVMIYCLGAIGDPRAVPVLEDQLKRHEGPVYQDILYALALAGREDALLRTLRTNRAVQLEPGATTLDFIAGVLGTKAVPVLVREIPRRAQESRVAALSALGTIGDAAATEFLLAWSRQPNVFDRRFAIVALARIGDPRARDRILEALSDPDLGVREAAAEAAGTLRVPGAVPTLTALLAPTVPSTTRFQAIWALGLIGGKDATEALVGALERSDGNDRLQLLQALGRTRHPAAVPALGREALVEDASLATQAAQGLVLIPGAGATEKLLETCDRAPVPEAGLEAAREAVERRDPRAIPCALQRLRKDFDNPAGFGQGAESLLEQLLLSAPPSAAASLDALAEGVPAPAIQHRLRSVASGIRMVHELGPDPAPWIELLDRGTPAEVDLAIERLGEIGDPRAVEPLRRLFGRIEPERAHRIPQALGKIASDRATPFLVALVSDDIYRVPSLLRARQEAARALSAYTRSDAAVTALKTAFVEERGLNFVPLMAFARLRGIDGMAEILELKPLLLRRRGPLQVQRNEKAVWALRMVRSGREIPLEDVADVR